MDEQIASEGTQDFRWFTGLENESTFSRPFLTLGDYSPNELPDFYKKIEASGDDRSYAINSGIVLEYHYDSMLSIVLLDYEWFLKKRKPNFSFKVDLLRSFRLIPPLIPDCGDCVRDFRNKFAHNLSIASFDEVATDSIDVAKKLYDRINEPYRITSEGKSIRDVFKGVVFGALVGLTMYQPNLIAYRKAIDDPSFSKQLEMSADGRFKDEVRKLRSN